MKKLKYVNVLIVSCLLAMAVFNNRIGQNIVVGLIVAWVTVNAGIFLQSLFKKLYEKSLALQAMAKAEKQPTAPVQEQTQAKPANEAQLTAYEKAVFLHFNCRITDKLKEAYPGVTWQWKISNPVEFALKGGIGRIQLFNSREYSYAEIKLDQFGRMDFSMIKVETLEEKAARPPAPAEASEKPDAKKTDVAAWFEGVGGDVLNELITEFNTQGHTRLLVEESGDVFLSMDGKKTMPAKKKLPDFPGKDYWNDLIKVLKVEDIKAAQRDNQLLITWN